MRRWLFTAGAAVLAFGAITAVTLPSSAAQAAKGTGLPGVGGSSQHVAELTGATDLSKIKHVVMIMQENHSYDNYFGTFPHSNGIPTDGKGNFADSTCLADILTGTCQKPYHSPVDGGIGGDHSAAAATADIDGGKMDGYLAEGQKSYGHDNCTYGVPSSCIANSDVMSYKDAREIPNYWQYAEHYTLADKTFESVPSWSGPSHLYMVSEWAAKCTSADPMSCTGDYVRPFGETRLDRCDAGHTELCPYLSWTDMTYLLQAQDQSWRYYVQTGAQPDCYEAGAGPAKNCEDDVPQSPKTPSIWNPLRYFEDVKTDDQLGNIQDVRNFYPAAADGTLPAVTWVVPAAVDSEHPNVKGGNRLTAGEAWTTGLINAVMTGPDWDSTAIFVSWDDWGGEYDHVKVPASAGIRVPLLVISPYAKPGYVDNTYYGIDSVNRFIEDVFLGGQRLDPKTDGRPDSRPKVNELRNFVGDLTNAFDFTQDPQPPLILPQHPLPGPPSCIDNVCDTHYTTDVSTRLLQTGAVRFPVTVDGNGFVDGAKVSLTGFRTGQRTTISNVNVIDAKTVSFDVTIVRGAATGWANVVVTNPDGTVASCNGCVQVTAGPTITGISPSSVPSGTSTSITLSGTNFADGATIASVSGIKINDVSVVDDQTITATATVPSTASPGNYRVTVTNPATVGAGTASCTCLTVAGS